MAKGIIIASSKISDGNMSFAWGEENEVIKNRAKFLAQHNLTSKDCVVMKVDHGDTVKVVTGANKLRDEDDTVLAEALITQEKDLALFLLTADCLPIVLHDPAKEVIALAHLGWKPTDQKLIVKTIQQMVDQFGSGPKDLAAYIGPSIHKESYVFNDPIQKSLPDWQPFLTDLPSGDTAIDLVAYNKAQMVSVGLLPENIFVDPTDTATSQDYFSHYRSVQTGEPEGRFTTIVALRHD